MKINMYLILMFNLQINSELVTSGIMVSELGVNRISYEDYLLNRMGMLNVGSGVGQYV